MCENTESLKVTHLPALQFRSNDYLYDFLPSYLPFHKVYKYWQNLPASVEVSLHLSSFLAHYFALWFLFPLLDFVIILCDSNYLVWLWFLSIVLWCLLPLSTSLSRLYNMDWVLESKKIVFLVFQIFVVIFLHNFVLELLFNKSVCCDWYMWYIHSSFWYCGLAYI